MLKNIGRCIGTALLVLSCSLEDKAVPECPIMDETVSKIANSPESAVGGMLVLYFSEEAVEQVEDFAETAVPTRSVAMTRSGIADMDEILSSIGIVSIERVFAKNPATEDRTRAAGLHRWYVVTFSPEQDVKEAAERLAQVAEIETIQYGRQMKRASDFRAIPFTKAAPSAKAITGYPFNDPDAFWQWHYINNCDYAVAETSVRGADVNVADAWKLTAGDPRVIVAVVDEAVKYTHPDLADNMWVNEGEIPGNGIDDDGNGYIDDVYGYNFVETGPVSWSEDDTGHGTHVAGTIAAVNNNGVGVCGIAGGSGNGDGVRVMSCQIFSGKASATDVVTAQAIKYAADNGACILQCSYGFSDYSMASDKSYRENFPLEVQAIEYFRNTSNLPEVLDGGVIVFASGNDAYSQSSYPGAIKDNISVTAFGPDFLPASYTNYGAGCNIAAPGGETTGLSGGERAGILSTLISEASKSDYGYMQGTSMACPHVSGVASLGLSYALKLGKKFTLEEFNSMLLTSVNDINKFLTEGIKVVGANKMPLSRYYGQMGTGAIDAYQLLMQVEGTPCLKAEIGKETKVVLSGHFGQSAADITYKEVIMSEEDREALGMELPVFNANGEFVFTCTKPGSAKVTVKAVAGGKNVGGDTATGGFPISREFSIIARDMPSNGAWL